MSRGPIPDKHQHVKSDEIYIVLKGAMIPEVEEERMTIAAGEVCFVPAGVFHAVIAVDVPMQGFVIRSPASQDKTYRDA